MRFFGSAMLTPHVDGGFAKYIVVRDDQVIPYDPQISSKVMVFAEPLAVAIHAINQAGSLIGKKVLITGAGPIGSLVVAACKQAGAVEIIASDIQESCRQSAVKMGATSTIKPLEDNTHYFQKIKATLMLHSRHLDLMKQSILPLMLQKQQAPLFK